MDSDITHFDGDWYEISVSEKIFRWLIDCMKEFSELPDRICILTKNYGFDFQSKVVGRHWTASGKWFDIIYFDDEKYADWKIYKESEHIKSYTKTIINRIPLENTIRSFNYIIDNIKGTNQLQLAEISKLVRDKVLKYWNRDFVLENFDSDDEILY